MGKKGGTQETSQQRAAADVARQQMADWKARWLPVQQQFAKNADAAMSPDSWERKRLEGASTVDSAARFGVAQNKLTANAAQTGSLGSSRQKLATVGLGSDQATSTGLSKAAADQAATDSGVAGLQAVTALGRGEKAVAANGLARSAALSGAQAQADAEDALAARIGRTALASKAIGTGAGLWSKPEEDMGINRYGETSLLHLGAR